MYQIKEQKQYFKVVFAVTIFPISPAAYWNISTKKIKKK